MTCTRQGLVTRDGITVGMRDTDPAKGDLAACGRIYHSLWCNYLRERGQGDIAVLASEFLSSAKLLRSSSSFVVEAPAAAGGIPKAFQAEVAAVYGDGPRVIGVCMAGLAGATDERWRKDYERLLAQATSVASHYQRGDDVEGSLFGDIREQGLADRLIASGSPFAEAELNLFMLFPAWQHRGLGSQMIAEACRRMSAAGARRFFLTSDNHSDYQFYDHLGMERIVESDEQDTGDGFRTYVYGGSTARLSGLAHA